MRIQPVGELRSDGTGMGAATMFATPGELEQKLDMYCVLEIAEHEPPALCDMIEGVWSE